MRSKEDVIDEYEKLADISGSHSDHTPITQTKIEKSDRVAVTTWFAGSMNHELKRLSVLFDKIAVCHHHTNAECEMFSNTVSGKETLALMDVLHDKGILFSTPKTKLENAPWIKDISIDIKELNKPNLKNVLASLIAEEKEVKLLELDLVDDEETYHKLLSEIPSDIKKNLFNGGYDGKGFINKDLYSRVLSLQLSNENNINSTPSIIHSQLPFDTNNINADAVTKLVYDNIPIALEETPWGALFEFREDEEAKNKLSRLRFWIERISNAGGLNILHLQNEINELVFEYESYMNIQHKKFKSGRLETLVVGGLELIEGVPKLQLSKGIKTLFSLKQHKINLLEAEVSAPGKELAYISSMRDVSKATLNAKNKSWWKSWKRHFI